MDNFDIVGGVVISYFGNDEIVVIPEKVIAIGPEAFKGNLLVKKVIFSTSVKEIQERAFYGCKNLESIENNENVEIYKDECFEYSGLVEVNISSNVTFLGKYCFANMPNLKTLIYKPGRSLKLNYAFYHCPKLDTVIKDKFYFYPSPFLSSRQKSSYRIGRPTLSDGFVGCPYLVEEIKRYKQSYKKGVCHECGSKIRKCLFFRKCKNCGFRY